MKKKDIVKIINKDYKDYDGYVQFSHRRIDKEKDIFCDGKKVEVQDEEGFILEAHFYSKTKNESIQIRQVNDSWLIFTTDLTSKEYDVTCQSYISDIEKFPYVVKMAQIWEEIEDELCENMPVQKLKKVVFAGFEGGKK